MYKIELSKKILEKHLAYFNKKVGIKLDIWEGENQWSTFLKKNEEKTWNEIKLKHKDEFKAFTEFMQNCKEKEKTLAVGRMEELKGFQLKLNSLMKKFNNIEVLKDAVEYAFDYDSFRDLKMSTRKILQSGKSVDEMEWCAYTFVTMLGLRVCPYCNEQYIAPTVTENGCVRGDLDHFLSRKKYPYFALSIYNLIPCCKFCNSSLKGDEDFNFDETATPYEVSYNDCFDFVAVNDKNGWKISLDNSKQQDFYKKAIDILKIFLIEARYRHHTDVIKDYLIKDKYYNEYFIEKLEKNHTIDMSSFLSCYFGYPVKEEEINDNVLNKLKRDLAKGLLNHVF